MSAASDGRTSSSGASARGVAASPSGPAGARESGAGDQFHFLWAARRAIELLDASTGLGRVILEGFSPAAPVSVDADLLLGADLVEYYGGDTFESATTIVVTQLKYSHRHPDKAWTAARMCTSSRGARSSVTKRLAEVYTAQLRQDTRARTIARLQLRLVSNQPVSAKLGSALNHARVLIAEGQRGLTAQNVIDRLPRQESEEIRRLNECAALRSRDFLDFLCLLDLSECGAEPRGLQELRLAAAIARHLPGEVQAATDRIYRKIESEALPEGEMSLGLARADILVTFGVHSEEALLPVPARFEEIKDAIPTPDVAGLADALVKAVDGPLIAHGDAGVGKTTTVSLLESALPANSVVIAYDCFGGGSYLDPAEGRHLPERAVLQLVNELAMRCGTPLLLKPPQVAPDLWRALRVAIEAASSAVREAGGLLVVVMDAADNAAFAARQSGDRSFLPKLWQLQLPEGARLLVTARTHRVVELQAPEGTDQFELSGFDESASTVFLRRRFPSASDVECSSFHASTGGNPRVQFYVLDAERSPNLTIEGALADAARTPAVIFKNLVDAAVRQVPDPLKAKEILANLVCSVRPARIASFSEASGLTSAEGLAFCHGLAPGAVIGEDTVSFRDEDFEQHLRDQIGPSGETSAHRRLAAHFLTRDETDEEAATVVAEHLYRGEQYQALVDITLLRGEPTAVCDSVIRQQVYRRRLTFALRAALHEGRQEDAFRLTVLAGEAARSDSALESIIRDHPDLAMHHGDPRGVAAVYLRQENAPWRGPLHLRISAMYAREGEFGPADEHFAYATAWLREALTKTEDHSDEWRISIGDIAAGAQAVYWRHGLSRALQWLRSWRPEDAVFGAVNRLAIALVRKCDLRQLEHEITGTRMSARFEAVFRGRLWAAGLTPTIEQVQSLADLVERSLQRQSMQFTETWRGDFRPEEEWLLEFTEMAACAGLGSEQLLSLVRQSAPDLPQHAPSEWDDLGGHSLALRRCTLEAVLMDADLTVDALIPDRLREEPDNPRTGYDKNSEERRRYREVFGEVLPSFLLRAKVLAGKLSADEVSKSIGDQLSTRREKAGGRWGKFDRRYRLWAMTVVDAALRSPGVDATSIVREVADAGELAVKDAAPALWLDLASFAMRRLSEPVGEGLVDRAATYVEENDQPASDRVQTLLQAARLVDPVDSALAQDYYVRAVAAAAGIDDDSIALLVLHARLAERVAPADPSSGEIAARMVGLVEEFERKVTDPDRLPRTRTIEAVATLHPPTAFATATRWDDEDRVEIDESISALVHGAVNSKFIQPDVGLLLLRLGGERLDLFEAAKPMLDSLKQQGRSGHAALVRALDELSLRIRRDLSLWARPAQARLTADWATNAGLGALVSVRQLAELAEYSEKLQAERTQPDTGRIEQQVARHDSVRPPIAGRSDIADHLRTMAESYASDEAIAEYIVVSGRAVRVSERVAFLEALGLLLPSDRVMRWYSRGVASALYQLVRDWRRSQAVLSWARHGIPTFIENNFLELIGHDRQAGSGLDRLLALPLGEDSTTLLLRAVSTSLDELSSHQLFAVAASVAELFVDDQVRDALVWSIDRLEEGTPQPIPDLPTTPQGTLAAFLFALFGNVDKRKRWRAAHVARLLLGGEDQAHTDELVAHVSSESAGAFMSPRHAFYWLSARQWLMLVIARVADESPRKLRAHLDLIADVAMDRELPHAAIRDMTRRAALAIHAASSPGLSEEKLEAVRLSNMPSSCYVERKHRYSRSRGDEEPDLRFKFDSMDTLPYWYSPLSDVFGLATSEISIRAEKWIVDRLGYTEEDTWKDRRELARERQWQLMRNDHGSIPVLESLDVYLKYHGMLLAAGQLVDEGVSVGHNEWDEPGGPWGYWLSDHVESSPHWWLSDLRSPSPLAPYVYGEPGSVVEWLEVAPAEFDDLLVIEQGGEKRLVVHSYISSRSHDRHESLYLRTALVLPETSHSLMRALQTADANDFFLPYEGSDESSEARREILEGEFELRGLLLEESIERESIEEHDPLARIRYSFNRPGEAFMTHEGAQPNRTGLQWTNDAGSIIAEVTMWKDELGDEREARERQTEGTRTSVPLDAILRFLKTIDRELIIDVEIDRKEDRRDEGWGRDYEPAKSRIYLLTKDGLLESLEGKRSL
ncbi:MAG: hypothetical protein JXA57_16400 [Armatimonadetes bacterium]|nr:hypothetical protein [Armatimonadota bacterium]